MYWCSSAGESPSRGEVVPERFLDHDACRRREIGLRQTLDHRGEQGRRDLQVEHRVIETFDGISDALVGGGIIEITLDVRQLLHELVEDILIKLFTSCRNGLASALYELVYRPVVNRHAYNGARKKATLLQSV
jgi:hypothetical protein